MRFVLPESSVSSETRVYAEQKQNQLFTISTDNMLFVWIILGIFVFLLALVIIMSIGGGEDYDN
jgi:hypothetical protein